MRKFTYKILFFFIFLIPFLIPLIGYNIWLDPYGVIRGDMQTQKTEPNQHYLKIKYCIDNPKKYNAFLFGSSRVGRIDLSKIHDGNNWYNFTYSECVPYETLQDIRLLLHSNIDIKQIIIGLDEISYLVSHKLHNNQSMRKSYVNKINPYIYYLFLRPSHSVYKNILNADTDKFFSKGMYSVIYKDGYFPPNKKDVFIEKKILTHYNDRIFKKPYWQPYYKERIDEAISEIKEIKQLCDAHDVKVVFFINPIYKTTFLKAVENKFFTFLERLTIVTEYYNFSGVNNITSNPFNYYENSHYRPIVGDWIIDDISRKNTKWIVNKDNISTFIKEQQIEIIKVQTHNKKYTACRN